MVDRNDEVHVEGFIDNKRIELAFQGRDYHTTDSIIFHFKKKDADCPSFVAWFYKQHEEKPIFWMGGACKEGEKEVQVRDELVQDWDRHTDEFFKIPGNKNRMYRFKGSIEFENANLEDYGLAEWDVIFNRSDKHSENTFPFN